MRIIILVLCLITVSAAGVDAAPVYLSCQVTDFRSKKVTLINITLDEATKQVSYVIVDTGFTQSLTGVFNPDTVFFVSPGSLEVQFDINRISLSLQRTAKVILDGKILIQETDTGTCSIVQAPRERKF